MKFNGNITLNTLGQSEIQNLVVERLAVLPAFQAAEAGRLVYNTADKLFYMNTGLAWVALATGGDAASLQTEVDNLEASLGAAITSTGGFDAAAITVVAASSITDAINKLGASVAGKDSLSKLLDVALTNAATGQFLRFDGVSGKWVNHTPVLADITGVTASAAEVNHLVGVTAGVQGQIDAVKTTADKAATDLAAEITRATDAEEAIAADLAQEIADRIAAGEAADGALEAAKTELETAISLKVSKAGDSMTGNLAMGGNKVIGVALPTSGEDAVNKNYVDSLLSGLAWEAPVDEVVEDIANFSAGSFADGYRVADKMSNSIYTVTAGSLDGGKALEDGDAFFDKSTETGYVFSGTAITQFTGGGQITAGIGLAKNGNQLDVNLGAGIAQLPSDEVGVDVLATGGLFLTEDGSTDSTGTAAQLSVKLDGATLTRGAAGLKVSEAVMNSISANADAIAAEVDRAEAAEQVLTDAIAAEKTRAEGVEADLRADLDAEVGRATGEELALLNRITNGYFLYEAAEAATSHTVTHNIGVKYCNVTVIDADEQIIPQSVVFNSDTQLTVTFNVPVACAVVVMGRYVPAANGGAVIM